MVKQSNSLSSYTVGSKSFTAVAINTASKAGEWIKLKLGTHEALDEKTSSRDLVTEVDKGAEKLIRRLLQAHFPEHAILGEEGVAPGAAASQAALAQVQDEEYLWIVDPIDGTTNFVHSFPFFSVSIALAHRGEVIVGVIYDPIKDEMFVAEKGKGAYLRGKKMVVSTEKQLSDSLLATGFPGDAKAALPLNMAMLQDVVPRVRNIRSSGSAALHLAYVAAGRLSGFWEIGLNAWDIAAGALLVQEAGGRISGIDTTTYDLSVRDVVATNGYLQSELQSALQRVAQERTS